MRWFQRRAELETELRLTRVRVRELGEECDYWRTRAERLLDNALARKGEAIAPVMAPQAPSQEKTFGSVFGPLAVTEIESGRRRGGMSDGLRPDDGLPGRSD